MQTKPTSRGPAGSDAWADLLFYSGAAFGCGVLLGLTAFLANDKGDAGTNWGSYADWTAAFGGLLAAASTIVIAVMARGELKRRSEESYWLAIALSSNPIVADMEMIARLSRGYAKNDPKLLPEHLTHWARSLQLAIGFKDLSPYGALPQEILRALAKGKSFMPLLEATAVAYEKKPNRDTLEYLVYVFEMTGYWLMPAANYLRAFTNAEGDALWEGWEPAVDPQRHLQRIRATHG